MSDKKYILIVAGSHKCAPCKEFSEGVLPQLKPWLERKGIEWAEIKIKDFNIDEFSEVHEYLPEVVSRLPTIFLVPLSEWQNKTSELKGLIYWPKGKARTLDESKNWIRSVLKKLE